MTCPAVTVFDLSGCDELSGCDCDDLSGCDCDDLSGCDCV